MTSILVFLWLAGFVQIAIAFANLFIPKKLSYQENLSRVAPIIRQIFVVHSVYIVGVVLLFAVVTFGFAAELASGRGLGPISGGSNGSFLAMPRAGAAFVLRRVAAANEPRGRRSVHLGGVVPDHDLWSGRACTCFMKGSEMGNVSDAAGSFRLVVLLDAAVWLALALGCWIGWFQLTVIELLFLLAPWIVVPLATLVDSVSGWFRAADWPTASVEMDHSCRGGFHNFLLLYARRHAGGDFRRRMVACLCFVHAARFAQTLAISRTFLLSVLLCNWRSVLLVGGTWLVASRLGLQPVGFQEPIVSLTAVHFTSRDSVCGACRADL